MEDYQSKPADTLHRIFSFLNLDRPNDKDLNRMLAMHPQNQGDRVMKEKTGAMLDKTRKMLGEFYRPYNEQLAKLLDDEGYLWKHEL
jgi:N-acetylgalactosamine 4-sulfate 6-O-sulfotransferase